MFNFAPSPQLVNASADLFHDYFMWYDLVFSRMLLFLLQNCCSLSSAMNMKLIAQWVEGIYMLNFLDIYYLKKVSWKVWVSYM